MSLKQNVINALMSAPVRWVNFSFANRMISPICFYMLAGYVNSGRVQCATDSSLSDHAEYDPGTDTIRAADGDYGGTYWDEKSTLIHECAHAILDCIYAGKDMSFKSAPMTVLDDETVGYLAGAIYLIAAGAGTGGTKGEPDYEAREIARPKITALMKKPWTGCETIAFTNQDVATLQAAIKKHRFYKNTWSSTAKQNGAARP
jgi:hypothetical protein